jgi:alpha/beta superfamily hydrolase
MARLVVPSSLPRLFAVAAAIGMSIATPRAKAEATVSFAPPVPVASVAPTVPAPRRAAAATTTQIAAAERPAREKHPAIRAAIRSLEKAKVELQHADHDFGGHRVEAIGAIDNALSQLRLALQYDKK